MNVLKTHFLPFKLLLLIGILSTPFTSEAQVFIMGGGNVCNVSSDVTLQNKSSIWGYYWGAGVQYYPFKKDKFSIINELLFSRKGYQQDLDKNYKFEFNYLSMPILMNYSVNQYLCLQGGVELSQLVNVNVAKGMDTYNHFDAGLVFGLSGFDNQRVSFYMRMTYGVTPILDYVSIDEIGNFNGNIKDLHNVCFSFGIKFNMYNKKIYFQK